MISLQTILTVVYTCICFIEDAVHGSITAPNERACPGFQTFTCQGAGNQLSWQISQSGQDFVYIFLLSRSMPTDTRRVDGQSATATATFNPETGNFSSTILLFISDALEGASLSCDADFVRIDRLIITSASLPSPPEAFRILSRQASDSSVNVIIGWEPPIENGGANIVSYSVTIDPETELSASVVSSPSITVSAADYNVVYTLNVTAINCIGASRSEYFTFTVGRCLIPAAPQSGSLGPVGNRLVGERVTFQCDTGPVGELEATCVETLEWNPDPATFPCDTIISTTSQSSTMFSTVELIISVVVTFLASILLILGVCGICLIIRRRSKSLAMENMKIPSVPGDYAVVEPNTWNTGSNVAYNSARGVNVSILNTRENVAYSSAKRVEPSTWSIEDNVAYSSAKRVEPSTWSIEDNVAYSSAKRVELSA